MRDPSDLPAVLAKLCGVLADLRAAGERLETRLLQLDGAVVKLRESEAMALKLGRPDLAEVARQRIALAESQKSALLAQLDQLREQEVDGADFCFCRANLKQRNVCRSIVNWRH